MARVGKGDTPCLFGAGKGRIWHRPALVELLEREFERVALDTLVERSARGDGHTVVLDGPPGVGKSALLAWLTARCASAGLKHLLTRATRLGAEVPFGIARRLLADEVRANPALLDVGWARRCRPLFDGEVPGAGLAAPLVEGLVALVGELIRVHGAVTLIVDDVQRADPSSLAFLIELAEREQDVRAGLAIAITSGQEATDDDALERLRALAGPRLMSPSPLSAAAVRRLVLERLPEGGEAFSARLADAAAGNPLLATELIDAAVRSGKTELTVPDGLSRLVSMRIERLTPEAGRLARAVAVLGEAPVRLTAELADLSPEEADAAADALVERRVLAAEEPLRFEQPILGDALLEAMPRFELAARHRRAAELQQGNAADEDQVAAHLVRTRPAGDAWCTEVLRRAARASLQRGDPGQAVRMLERAALEPPPSSERGELLIELARARAAAGLPSAIEAFEDALGQVLERSERARAWHGLSRLLYVRGEFRTAADAAARGLAELPSGDPRRERLLADELGAAILVPELSARTAARTEELIFGDRPTDPALLAQLIIHQSWRGIRVERLVELARAAVAADPLVDPESGGFALSFVAGALNMADEVRLSVELLDAGLSRVAQLGDPLAEVSLRCCRAWARIYQGDLRRAAEDLEAVLAMSELSWSAIDGLCGPPLVVLRLERGDLAGAREALERTPRGWHNPGLDWFAGAIAAAAGDYSTALEAFEAAGAELEGVLGMGNPGVLPWRSSAALAAARLGMLDRATALLAPELEQAAALNRPRLLGIALRTAGVIEDDPAQLERSVEVLEPSSARLELARSLLALGVAYRRARRSVEARAPLTRALALAQECGSTAVTERIRLELRATGARPRNRPLAGPKALTSSERNVAELAAAGKTTRQIADDLFLAPKTVEGHLTKVFRKLRISSRSELSAKLGPAEQAFGAEPG